MTDDRRAMLCGAVYPGEPHGQLTCVKPWGHEDDHTTCLGAHDHGDGDLEYVWDTWEQETTWDYRCRMCKVGVKWDGSKESTCPACGDTIDPRTMTLKWNLEPGTTIGKLIEEADSGR